MIGRSVFNAGLIGTLSFVAPSTAATAQEAPNHRQQNEGSTSCERRLDAVNASINRTKQAVARQAELIARYRTALGRQVAPEPSAPPPAAAYSNCLQHLDESRQRLRNLRELRDSQARLIRALRRAYEQSR